MIDLDFLSYADVHRKVIETIPALRKFPISSVTYVPRGGSSIAAIVCQFLDLPLLSSSDLREVDSTRCLLVDDMIVTGQSLAKFRHRFLPSQRTVPTYVFASVPQDRPVVAKVDIVSITVDPERYFPLPWEIGDIFRPTFPFPILVELDGVIRSPIPLFEAILSITYPIAHVLSFGHDEPDDRQWLTGYGYGYSRLTTLADPDDVQMLAELIKANHIRFYLGSDARHGTILKRLCPECHIVAFPEMTEPRSSRRPNQKGDWHVGQM
jgi:hypothetical protein